MSVVSPRHLLGIAELPRPSIDTLLALAARYQQLPVSLPPCPQGVLAFFEPSTRTSCSFALAMGRLGIVPHTLNLAHSSRQKGETVTDTLNNLLAMEPDFLVVRHSEGGLLQQLQPSAGKTSLINAGEGHLEHPSQALLDALTIQERVGRLNDLTIAIVGDIKHSRVARSNLLLHKKYGNRVRLFGPPALLPSPADLPYGELAPDLATALHDADVVMMLRIQHERLQEKLALSSEEYFANYGLDHARLRLAKANAVVLHPGPVNREVELASALMDDTRCSAILQQTQNGVRMRMAILHWLRGSDA